MTRSDPQTGSQTERESAHDTDDPLGLDTDRCDVCDHQGPDVELYDTRVQAGVRFDMPLCRWCAKCR